MRTKSSKILAIGGTLAILGAHSIEAFHSAYAEEREDEEREDEERGESRKRERESREDEREDGKRRSAPSTPQTSPASPVSSAPSTGTTRSCATVYDTVTNASGTQSQVPRQVCTDVPTGNSTTPSVPAVPTPVPTPVPVPAPVQVVKPVAVSALKDGTYSWAGTYSYPGGGIDYVVEITVSGGKISKAVFLNFTPSGNGLYTRAKGDAELRRVVANQNAAVDVVTGASGTSNAVQTAVNQALAKARGKTLVQVSKTTATPDKAAVRQPVVATATDTYLWRAVRYVAPNGKPFIVYPDADRGGKFTFKRADGSVSDKTFASRNETVLFLRSNNPSSSKTAAPIQAPTATVTYSASAAWKTSGKKKMKSVHVTGKTRGQVMAEAQRIADERAAAKAGKKTSAVTPAVTVAKPKPATPKPVVATPTATKPTTPVVVPVTAPVKAPVADTTTKAS